MSAYNKGFEQTATKSFWQALLLIQVDTAPTFVPEGRAAAQLGLLMHYFSLQSSSFMV